MDNDAQRKTAQELLQAIDETIATGPWEKSVFLGAVGKKLKDIRFNFKNRMRFLDPNFEAMDLEGAQAAQMQIEAADAATPRENQMQAFASLYNVDGLNIQKWEKILLSLDKQLVTRPVYTTERQVKALVRTKIVRKNDAYTAFYINKESIITPKDNKPPLDRLGNPLLLLKDNALSIPNITHFYHESGVYTFNGFTLTRISDMDYMDNT